MPITFQNSPAGSDPEKTLEHLQAKVRHALGIAGFVDIAVGMTRTTVGKHGVSVSFPFGVAAVKNFKDNDPLLELHRAALYAMFPGEMTSGQGHPVYDPNGPPLATLPASAPKAYNDMTDEQWVEHVSKELFPGVLPLHQTTDLYQPVMGTSGGSVYKTCFVGPDLRIAARIKKNGVSFRATTASDNCPQGAVRAVIERLGVTSIYENRMTTHAEMSGPYNSENAHEYRALFGAFYAALKPWITSNFPAIGKLAEGVK